VALAPRRDPEPPRPGTHPGDAKRPRKKSGAGFIPAPRGGPPPDWNGWDGHDPDDEPDRDDDDGYNGS